MTPIVRKQLLKTDISPSSSLNKFRDRGLTVRNEAREEDSRKCLDKWSERN